jgi:DNA-binding transcriptional MerR regulator
LSERFLIGELARRTGHTVHAIRWYEAQGLIPGVVRDVSGRRVYTVRHQSWLELIDRLRRTGMSVAQMREYAALVRQGSATLNQQQALLEAHREKVKATIAEWTKAMRLINRKISFYDEWAITGQRPARAPHT